MSASITTNGAGKKMFIPLENNPEVFSHLIQHLGASLQLGFYDIYSLEDPSLTAHIPRPIYALLFICPANVYHKARDEEHAGMEQYTGSGAGEPVMWFKQTIGNACGLIGLLHGVSNGGARSYITAGSALDEMLKEALPLAPEARAKLLYNSQALEDAHKSAAILGDTEAPSTSVHLGHHYICFVKADDGHLWELNGGMKGPVDRGSLELHEDVLSDKALTLGIKTFMQHAGPQDMDFSIVALAPTVD